MNTAHIDGLDPWPGDEETHDPTLRRERSPRSIITGVTPDPAHRDRQHVHLDEWQTVSVHRKVCKALDLKIGQQWDRKDLARQCRDVEYKAALQTAIALLTKRSRSIADIGRRLKRKGYSQSASSAVLHRLTQLRLLNDEQFAADLLDSLQQRQRFGQRAVLDRMRREGLPRDIAERVIEERTDDEGEAQRALELARKRLSRMTKIDPAKARQRVYAYLLRRGFASQHAAQAVGTAMAGMDDEAPAAEALDTW